MRVLEGLFGGRDLVDELLLNERRRHLELGLKIKASGEERVESRGLSFAAESIGMVLSFMIYARVSLWFIGPTLGLLTIISLLPKPKHYFM